MANEKGSECMDTVTTWENDQVYANATQYKAGRPGISYEESRKVYNEWASVGTYDEVMNAEKYRGPAAASRVIENLFPSNRENILILDAACGSGMVAEHLQRQGFKRIHGFDASPGMLDLARQKNVYDKLTCCFLDSSPLPMGPETYDCAVVVGGFVEGHIPTTGLRSLWRVVKPGGVVVLMMREAFLWEVAEYKDRLEKEMETMEREGLWRMTSKTLVPNYFHHHVGVTFVFRLP